MAGLLLVGGAVVAVLVVGGAWLLKTPTPSSDAKAKERAAAATAAPLPTLADHLPPPVAAGETVLVVG